MLTRDEARALTDRIFKLSHSSEVAVNINWRQNCNTRFANNQITTAGFTTDLRAGIDVTQGRKTGTTSTTEISDEALARAVRRAEELAALAPSNPEYVEPLGPQDYPQIAAFDDATASARSDALFGAVRSSIEAAEGKKLKAFGFFDIDTIAGAIANNKGLFGYHPHTWAGYSLTMRTPDGTGRAGRTARRPGWLRWTLRTLEPSLCARRLTRKIRVGSNQANTP